MHDVRVRRHDDPLLALLVLDQEGWLPTAAHRSTDRAGWLDSAVGHGAVGCAVPSWTMTVALAAHRLSKDVHFDRLLAAVGLRRRAAADIGAGLDVGDCCLQHGDDRRVVSKLERDRGAVAPLPEDSVAIDPFDRAGQTLGLLLLLLRINSGNRDRRNESGSSQDS